jgi:hypothetical protein
MRYNADGVKRLIGTLRRHVPQRRLRRWQYVSPYRHRIGLVALAVILGLGYAGWYFTNDSRIRGQAKLALEDLTGADVDVERAEFSIFEGIRLYGVKVRIREYDSPEHFFKAEQVYLKHRPGGLLLRGRLEPTDIVCLRPVVTLERAEGEPSNAEKLFELAAARLRQRPPSESSGMDLPRIDLRGGTLKSVLRVGGVRNKIYEEPMDCSLVPVDRRTYRVSVESPSEEDEEGQWARIELDVKTGEVRQIQGTASNPLLRVLPAKYHRWIEEYQLAGSFKTVQGPQTDPAKQKYKLELNRFSLRLPPDKGGLELVGVEGMVFFDQDRVRIEVTRGVIAQAGRAPFTLDLSIHGLDDRAVITGTLQVKDLVVPETGQGPLEFPIRYIQRAFQPKGKADLTLRYQRQAEGSQELAGTFELHAMRGQFEEFPVPLNNVRGVVEFDSAGLYLGRGQRDGPTAEPPDRASQPLLGQRPDGRGEVVIWGRVPRVEDYFAYDVRLAARNILLDDEIRDALPEDYREVWNRLQPSGRVDLAVHLDRAVRSGPPNVDLTVRMRGETQIVFRDLPYPLKRISGTVTYRDGLVRLKGVKSGSGKPGCRIEGTVTAPGPKPKMDLRITDGHLAIDQSLIGALGKAGLSGANLLPGGEVRHLTARIYRRERGGDLRYTVHAELNDARLTLADLPLRLDGTSGDLVFTQDGIRLENVAGHYRDSPVRLDGTLRLPDAPARPITYDMQVDARGLVLDNDLRNALPPSVQAVWDDLDPRGKADMKVRLASTDAADGSVDYRLVLDAHDMSIRHKDFPYRIRGITGRARVRPGKVTFEDVRARQGQMRTELKGEFTTSPGGRRDVDIALRVRNLPLDRELLEAIPQDALPLARKLAPGGTVSVDLRNLTLSRRPAGKADEEPRRISEADSQPATRPASKLDWSAEGELDFQDVTLDFGFGPRTLSGTLDGRYWNDTDKFGLDTRLALSRLTMKKHVMTGIRGRVVKSPDSNVLRFDQLEASAHDGKITGEASFRLTDPLHYELSVQVWNVNLEKLFNAGVKDLKKRTPVKGLLAGRLSLEATAGKTPSRQAVGQLQITRGEIYKMPVLLGLLNVVYLQLPSESGFNRGLIDYHLKNDLLRLKQIYLTGFDRQTNIPRGISVLGSGTLNMKNDKLNLTFLTGPPGKVPLNIGDLTTELLHAFSKELLEIRITGTLAKPEVNSMTLRSVERILRRLIQPPPM